MTNEEIQKLLDDATTAVVGAGAYLNSALMAINDAHDALDPVEPPPPTPPNLVVSQSIIGGQTITTPTEWTATANAPIAKMDFSIDDQVKWTEKISPYYFNGDNQKLDPATLTDGQHELKATATDGTGQTASVTATVTTHADPPPPPPTGLPQFGCSTGYDIIVRTSADQDFELNEIQACGFKMVRYDCHPGIEQKVVALDTKIRARGMESYLTYFGTNKTPRTDSGTFPTTMTQLVKGKVRLFEINNEPDLNGWDATVYAPFAFDAALKIQAVIPDALVFYGGIFKSTGITGRRPADYAKAFVAEAKKRGKQPFYAISEHLYDQPDEWQDPGNIWHMTFPGWPAGNQPAGNTVREILDADGFADVHIISSECGSNAADQAVQARNALDLLNQVGAVRANIAMCFYYRMIRDGAWKEGALLNADRTRRQAWTAVKQKITA